MTEKKDDAHRARGNGVEGTVCIFLKKGTLRPNGFSSAFFYQIGTQVI